MTNPSETKAGRLLQIEALLLAHPEGMTQAELARRLGVNRSTIGRYVTDLPKHLYIDEANRWVIDREAYLVNVRFSLHEAMAVHLAARLLATRMDRQNPHAAAALRKLGVALERIAPHISAHLCQSADRMDDPESQMSDPKFLGVLEKLTLAWAEGRKVHLWHRHERGQVDEYRFSPYFIEPYAVGQSVHAIGWREPPGALRTFKVERIERAEIVREDYTIPADFDVRRLLGEAWGIWYTENEPVEVRLRFSPAAARRVMESRWHPGENKKIEPDGSLLWRAKVAAPIEMLPWVRGWGADVEVLGPESLRQALVREARKMARLYGVANMLQPKPIELLWAKAQKQTGEIHLLIYHMLDTAAVAIKLWENALSDSVKQEVAAWMGLGQPDAGRTLAFWAALHDIGKASPVFQIKNAAQAGILAQTGLPFEKNLNAKIYHSRVSGKFLREHGVVPIEVDIAISGHHGAWNADYSLGRAYGDQQWDEARSELLDNLKLTLSATECQQLDLPDEESANLFTTWLSGFLCTADWIASNEDYFPYISDWFDLNDYFRQAEQRAADTLCRLGWIGWKASGHSLGFSEMYPHIQTPRPIQSEVIRHYQDYSPQSPFLMIVEAPTGIGKTEIALYIADLWLQEHGGSGLYIAMPSQATSNQIYQRTTDVLRHRFPDEMVNLVLAHGQAAWSEAVNAISVREVGEGDDTVLAAQWFQKNSKRALLAPFGVGTVDQAFLSVLQTKFFFVRLFGLKNKVVIFDEVHAYDTYMNTLFIRLLRWLRALNVPVIILSATLPDNDRKRLAAAYSGCKESEIHSDRHYPRLTLAVSGGETQSIPLSAPPTEREIALTWRNPSELTDFLNERLIDGGCAAIICNTVSGCLATYDALKQSGHFKADELYVFHARFPFVWRDEIEKKILGLFGKGPEGQTSNPDRPYRAIVIATQVVEQSLDLDFDLMISELAPVDLILQRAGRLHRHERSRPFKLSAPQMAIFEPEFKEDGTPVFGGGGWVYPKSILLQTYLTLKPLNQISTIQQTRQLIEQVYDNQGSANLPPILQTYLEQEQRKEYDEAEDAAGKAGSICISAPGSEDLLFAENLSLREEDDAGVQGGYRAMTRDIGPGLGIICLHRGADGNIYLDPQCTGACLDLERPDTLYRFVPDLLQRVVTIHRMDLLKELLIDPKARHVNTIAALRGRRMIIFEDGVYETGKFTLTLDQHRGLGIAAQ